MRRFIAALSAVALLTASIPALADSHRHRPYGYGHYDRHYGGHHYYGRRHHDHTGAVVVGALVGGLVLGHLLTRPVYYAPPPPPPPQPLLGNCLATTGVGYVNGQPAEFGGTMCYDQYGRAYILRGSEYFIGYLR